MGIATIQAARMFQFRIDPEAIQFNYTLNTSTENTYGGKVIQILSTAISDMTVPCMAGNGGRAHLTEVINFWKETMIWQRDSKNTAKFTYAPRKFSFDVYASALQIEDTLENITFPFTMYFKVNKDGGKRNGSIVNAEMKALADGIGYVRNEFNDPDKSTPNTVKATDPNGGAGAASATGTNGKPAAGGAVPNALGTPIGSEEAPKGQVFYDGTGPRLDTDGVDAPPFPDPTRQGQTSLPGLSAVKTAYVVVNDKTQLGQKFLIQNHTTKKSVIAIGGDIGHGFGEISYKAAQDLGMNITGDAMPPHHITISFWSA